MNTRDLIRTLEQVPEKELRLLELAWRCVGPDGKFDLELATPIAAEIEAAAQEVRGYMQETERLRWALDRLVQGR